MQMLDLIRDTMTFEFAAITNSINLIYSTLGTHVGTAPEYRPADKGKLKNMAKSVDIHEFCKINR